MLGLLSLVIALSLFQFTQTATGRNAAISLLQRALAGAMDGEVRFGPVLGGNLLTRVVLSRLEIVDRDGATFVALDSAHIEYDPLSLLRRQVRVRRLDVARAQVRLHEGADGVWNFERIFGGSDEGPAAPSVPDSAAAPAARPEPTPTEGDRGPLPSTEVGPDAQTSGAPLRVLIGDVSVGSGSIEIRTAWTSKLEGRGREAALVEAEADDGLWQVEKTPDGEYERVYRLDDLSGRFPTIRIVDPPRPFRVVVEDIRATLVAVRQPLALTELSGSMTFADTIAIDIDRLLSAASDLSGTGWVVAETPLAYRFELSADPVAFEDLAWLPIPVPETGGGPMDLVLASRGPDMVVTVSDGDVRSEDNRIRGGFTLALEEAPRFEALDLALQPVRIRWLNDLLDRPETIDGLVRGFVRGSGRIDALNLDAEVTLADLESGVATSELRARGSVAIVEPFPVRGLELRMTSFEPRWADILGLDPGLPGRLDGTVTIDRPSPGLLSFRGDMAHRTPAGDLSRLAGSGTVDFEGGSVIDVSIDAQPLALTALRPWVPDVELAGSVRGPLRTRGTRADLEVSTNLVTERGQLVLDGTLGLEGERPRYDVELEATDLSLDQWIEGAPASRLRVRGRVTGEGVDRETLAANFDLRILPSQLELVEIDESRVVFRVAEGLATVDTLVLRTDVGTFTGRGRFGLGEGDEGTLEFEAEVPDLSELNRWFATDIPGGEEAEAGEPLFESFEAALGPPPADEPTEGVSGRASVRGVAVGRLSDYAVEAFLEASAPRFETYRADTLSAHVLLPSPPGLDSLVTRLSARGASLGGRAVDSLALALARGGEGGFEFDVYARRDSTVELASLGALERGEGRWAAALERLRLRVGDVEADLAGPARVAYSDSAVAVDGLVLAGSLGRIEADGYIPAAGDGTLEVAMADVRIEHLAYLLSAAPAVSGTLSGSARVTGTLDDPRIAGSARIGDPAIRDQAYASLEAQFEYAERRIRGSMDLHDDTTRVARLEGSVLADLALRPMERRLLDDPIDLRIRAERLPLAILELRVRGLEEIGGHGIVEVTVRGAPGELRYGGSLRVVDGSAWVPDLGVRLVRVRGRAIFDGSEARVDSAVVASADGGSFRVSGSVNVASLADPEFDLDITGDRFHAVSRLDMSLKIDGRGHLGGRYTAPLLTGRFRLREGDIRQDEFLRARQIIDLSDPTIYALLDSASIGERRLLDRFRNPFMENLVLDLDLALGPNLWLRSPELDVEMVAEGLSVDWDRASERLVVVGTVELPRGTYRFDRLRPYVQSLRITSGTIQFVGGTEFNPNLAITAEYRNRTPEGPVVVEATIGGTLQSTELTLTSNPPMSDTDQLCFLAVGTPCFAAADAQLGQRLLQETFLGTLSSGISSALVGSTGLSYFNLRSVGGGNAAGVQGSQSLFDQTAVEFGWYAGQDIFFSVSQSLGGGPPRATLEWSFLPSWTLEARLSSRFDERLFGLSGATNLANEQTFGLFLFRIWDF